MPWVDSALAKEEVRWIATIKSYRENRESPRRLMSNCCWSAFTEHNQILPSRRPVGIFGRQGSDQRGLEDAHGRAGLGNTEA